MNQVSSLDLSASNSASTTGWRALSFGVTMWMTAPLTVIFSREFFGSSHLGAISGMIVMIHHMCGGLGAYLGAALFDAQGSYSTMFAVMLALSALGFVMTLILSSRS